MNFCFLPKRVELLALTFVKGSAKWMLKQAFNRNVNEDQEEDKEEEEFILKHVPIYVSIFFFFLI